MANTKVRGITIELSADASGVSKALKDVNSSINSTSKELRDIEKLLKLDPTNVELLEQKQKALQTQLSNTKDKLDILRKAQEDLNSQMENGGTEEQKKQMAALEREIIATEQSMKKYEDALDDTNKESEDFTKSQKQMEDGNEKLKEGFTVLKGVVANLVTDGLRKAVDALKDMATAGAAYADDILTMSTVTSLSTETLQEYAYMADLVDVNVETITGSMKKLTKNMLSAKDGTGSAAETFDQLGISVLDSNGELRNSEEVFNEIVDIMGTMENETERDALAMTVFGKSAQDLNPLIEAGSDQLKAFAQEAHDVGYVLEEEDLAALGKVQDAFDRWNRQVEATKNTIAVGFAPAMERAMKKANEALKSIDWKKIGKDIGNAFDKLIDAFEWILKNGTIVKGIVNGMIAAFAANKIATFTQTIISATSALKTATVAQQGMNAAANANPYILLATAIAAVGAALITFGKAAAEARYSASECGSATLELKEATDELIAENKELTESYKALEESKKASIDSGVAEINHARDLAAELSTLVDANGNVQEGYEARADFILGELNSALGTEYKQVDGVIQEYGELTGSIDALLQKKQAEIILSAQEESYRQAIINRTQAEQHLQDITKQRGAVMDQISENEARLAELDGQVTFGWASVEHDREVQNLRQSTLDLKTQMEDLDVEFQESKDTVDGYYYDIAQYESNYALAHDGLYDQISTTTFDYLKKLGDANTEYSDRIVEETERQTGQWKYTLADQLSTITGHKVSFKEAGNGLIQAYIDGQKAGEPVAETSIKKFGDDLAKDLKDKKGEFVSAGHSIDDGVRAGIDGNQWGALNSIGAFAGSILNQFKGVLGIASPSKKMIEAMGFVEKGIEVGLNRNKGKMHSAVDSFGRDFSGRLSDAMNGTAGVNLAMNGAAPQSGAMLNQMYGLLQNYLPTMNQGGMQLVLDSGELVGAIAPKMSNEFGSMQRMDLRGV